MSSRIELIETKILKRPGKGLLFCVLMLFLQLFVSLADEQTWVEDTFEDFIDGRLDASGSNIYVSRDGKIRTILRYDLNDDGYIDLLFCQMHDTVNYLPATLAEISPDRKVHASELSVGGSNQVEVTDLNGDGYKDLVFCPNNKGSQNRRYIVTIIYGGEDGWPPHRTTGALPVYDIKELAIADLNHDGWIDIVTLNGEAWILGQPPGNIVRIFWRGKSATCLLAGMRWASLVHTPSNPETSTLTVPLMLSS